MAGRKYTGYHRTNKDQLPLSTLPIPPKPEHNQELLKQMKEIGDFLHQKNLHNAVQLAIEAAQGRGTLIDYFAEMGRRFGTHTAPRKEAETEALIPFSFEGHPVRVIGKNDEPWWVLTDVCEVLDIRNNRDASSRLDSDEKADVGIADTSSKGVTQRRKVTIINESGLWSLVLTSRKPEARRFKRWLTSEVIPTIRRTGSYNPASSEALTAQETGGIVKGIVNKALRTEGPALVRAILAEQGFSLVEDYKTANGWLIEYKAVQKGRSGLTQRVGRTLRKLCEELGIPRHRCAVSGKWLYPSAVARPFFKGTGGHWVRMHNAAVALGQSAIHFGDEVA